MNRAKARERFGKTSKTVDWVEERRETVLAHAFNVKLKLD